MNKVLIVDDDEFVGNVYRNKFVVEGFQVELARDGQAGLEAIRKFRPDVVLLDLMLPKVKGTDLLKQIRSESDFKALPIIVVSNMYVSSAVQEAWKAGATKVLSKTHCTAKQILDVVRQVLSGGGGVVQAASAQTVFDPDPSAETIEGAGTSDDSEFQAELQEPFYENLPSTLATARGLLQATLKAEDESARLKPLLELFRCIRTLSGSASVAGISHGGMLAEALVALLNSLCEEPKGLTQSSLRTVAAAIDVLGNLYRRRPSGDREQVAAAIILVVDDEPISCRAVTHALKRARLNYVSVRDPHVACHLLEENDFSLVFLDVDMPEMNGFQVCAQLRTLSRHRQTPVVFVTQFNDLESRANSLLSGGTDFIAKPFMLPELAVKALTHVLRTQIPEEETAPLNRGDGGGGPVSPG